MGLCFMMKIGSTAHICMIIASVVLCTILIIMIIKSRERMQNIIITTISLIAVCGIFFLHGTHYFTNFDFLNLVKQMLVCLRISLYKKAIFIIYLFYIIIRINILRRKLCQKNIF